MILKKVILIVLIIIWMIIVFLFSGQQGKDSGNTSSKFIKQILRIFTKDVSEGKIQKMQLPIRKLAHFTIYAIGAMLVILLLNQYNISVFQKILYSQIFMTLYAITDEFHQKFVPGRTATIWDVIIDSIGALTSILLIVILFIKK